MDNNCTIEKPVCKEEKCTGNNQNLHYLVYLVVLRNLISFTWILNKESELFEILTKLRSENSSTHSGLDHACNFKVVQ